MEEKMIMLQSITFATKARNLLMKYYGIKSEIVKTPKINYQSSCGYSLYVPYRTGEALNILLSKGFTVLGQTDSDLY